MILVLLVEVSFRGEKKTTKSMDGRHFLKYSNVKDRESHHWARTRPGKTLTEAENTCQVGLGDMA